MELWTGQFTCIMSFFCADEFDASSAAMLSYVSQRSLIPEDVWPKPHGYSSHSSWLDAVCGQ
jgi:hypothetical protein